MKDMKTLKNFGIEIKKDNHQEVAIYGLACVYSFIDKEISAYLRPYNLSLAKFNALMVIQHIGKEKGLSQIEIGRRLIVTASNMTRLLDKLVKEGLVERLSRKGDRRVNIIKITKKGTEILDKAWPGYHKKILELANLLEKDELKETAKLIVKWCNKLGVSR
ncbi:MAG: hypothetical protein B1H08_01930 [Candidatus Omnitrophica bacterium 4484_171]|nr:MAG: hypothetical protein B1H08_01930 [Candidatus Omnitrophica bacterium 4484_171]